MLLSIAWFELRYQLRSPVFIAVFIIFSLLTFAGVTIDQVQVGSTAQVNVNSPHAITINLLIWSVFGVFIPAAILANGILRDASYRTDEIIFSSPIRKRNYLLGRFTGGFIATALAFISVPLAIMLGAAMPWLDPDNVGPFRLWDYVYLYGVIGVPNMLIMGVLFFSVASFTRSMVATYVTAAVLLVLYFIGNALTQEPAYREIAALADPFALNTYGEMVRYWPPFELNSKIVPFSGLFLYNRLIWLGAAAVLFAINWRLFSFRKKAGRRWLRRRKARASEAPEEIRNIKEINLIRMTPSAGAAVSGRQFLARIAFETKGVFKSPAVWVLLGLGLLNMTGGMLYLLQFYGTPAYPLTRVMINVMAGNFSLFPLIIVIYYGSILVWRERSVRFSEIVDATPSPNWVFVVSKFIAFVLIITGLFAVAAAGAMLFQLANGYTRLELGQYAVRIIVDFILPLSIVAALSLFAQIITNNRWLGMLVMIVYVIGTLTLANIGWDHNLYLYGGAPDAPYSDMNGYGHFLAISLWFLLYWGLFALFLLILGHLLWNRGVLRPVHRRLKELSGRMTPATVALAAVVLAAFAATGGWIYHNTNVLNHYMSDPEQAARAADYERRYKRLQQAPLPKIADVDIAVDIYPEGRRYDARGHYILENREDVPIDVIHIGYGNDAEVRSQSLAGGAVIEVDERQNMFVFELAEAMLPGQRRRLDFEVSLDYRGFRNSDNVSSVNYNGSFFNNGEAMPFIGYNDQRALQDPQARRRQKLEPIERLPKLEDENWWHTNYIRADSDFVNFRTTVSTSPEEIAVAPGYLQREWTQQGRRYFEYEMDAPILNFYSWLSADYAVREDEWNDIALQVFYHPAHDFNIGRMVEAMKDSLAYFEDQFSPFQHRQMRILEFPGYATFAQSFPNTVPYSENIGFIANISDPDDIDYVYYVTAHEVAHQWWAHQVMAANVQGGTFLVESLAQYSALMVMEKEYGPDHMRRFLKYELDSYLGSRGGEAIEELPLYRVENQQYIHYRKGSVVMYALKDYLGEDTVNRVLRRLIDLRGFSGEPYATTLDFMRLLREEAGPAHAGLITDLFEKITIFDLRIDEAVADPLEDGRWQVDMVVEAHKYYADGEGRQSEALLDLEIDVGVFSKNIDDVRHGSDHVLSFEKRRVDDSTMRFTVIVDEQPAYAGIDPYNKLIDRNSDDNVRRIDISTGPAAQPQP